VQSSCLFLLGGSLLLSETNALLLLSLVALLGTGKTESAESALLLLGGLNLALANDTLCGDGVDLEDGSDLADLLGLLDLLSGRVSLLGGLGVTGEQDELALVLVQAGNVRLEGLDGGVLAAVVDGDTDSKSHLAGDLGLL
jgi:hypothetical protein